MKNGGQACVNCQDVAHVKQGRQFLCKKHYRFQQMRSTAKRHNKTVPSYDWLENEFENIKNICPS